VDVQDQRVLFRGVEAVGLHDEDLDRLPVGARHGDLLGRAGVDLLLDGGVGRGEGRALLGARRRQVQAV
jgi:hypothetical protein